MMNKRANLGLPARHQNSKNTGTREFMDKHAVLSLSPDLDSLKARESVLRSNGLNVISVMSAIQARFEIEMGRCGVFLICYRISPVEAAELTRLFRKSCPDGRVIFVGKTRDASAPAGIDSVVSESSGPESLTRAINAA
jgi:DNA-binding NarL/FixJ family response regulator